MDKKGYTTESGGRQNGFALEPEINVISERESKKSLIIFTVIILSIILGFVYYLKGF
tara:strand:+ start:285 stop:455 length:171 start_codon:yes stop_codon:yes gene_type:complete